MKYYEYKNWKTGETVCQEEALEYALDKLGLKIEPKGQVGTYTLEQQDFKEMIVEWYFDGDWSKEEWKEEVYEEDYDLEMADNIYEENYNKIMED